MNIKNVWRFRGEILYVVSVGMVCVVVLYFVNLLGMSIDQNFRQVDYWEISQHPSGVLCFHADFEGDQVVGELGLDQMGKAVIIHQDESHPICNLDDGTLQWNQKQPEWLKAGFFWIIIGGERRKVVLDS